MIELAGRLRDALADLGFVIPKTNSAVVPIILGDPSRTLKAAEELRRRGLLVGAIRPPTVPEGGSRLRVSIQAAQTDSDLEQLIDAIRKEVGC